MHHVTGEIHHLRLNPTYKMFISRTYLSQLSICNPYTKNHSIRYFTSIKKTSHWIFGIQQFKLFSQRLYFPGIVRKKYTLPQSNGSLFLLKPEHRILPYRHPRLVPYACHRPCLIRDRNRLRHSFRWLSWLWMCCRNNLVSNVEKFRIVFRKISNFVKEHA